MLRCFARRYLPRRHAVIKLLFKEIIMPALKIVIAIILCASVSVSGQHRHSVRDSTSSKNPDFVTTIQMALRGQIIIASMLAQEKFQLKSISGIPDIKFSDSISLSPDEWTSLTDIITDDSLIDWKPYTTRPTMVSDGWRISYKLAGTGWSVGVSSDMGLRGGAGFRRLHRRLAEIASQHQLQAGTGSIIDTTIEWNWRDTRDQLDTLRYANTGDLNAIIVTQAPLVGVLNQSDAPQEEIVAFNAADGYSMRIQGNRPSGGNFVGKERALDSLEWHSLVAIVQQERLMEWRPRPTYPHRDMSHTKSLGFILQSNTGWAKGVSVSSTSVNASGIERLKERMLQLIRQRDPAELNWIESPCIWDCVRGTLGLDCPGHSNL